ncbi:MAG TPA: SDR family oxidoreductase [Bacillota bacterium]|nr:SDR family oxidoreductase [Bacillota bacterium]
MVQTYFMTGFPGFLTTRLIKQLIHDHRDNIAHIYLLVLPYLEQEAVREIPHLARQIDVDPEIFTVVPGDITKVDLALPEKTNLKLLDEITHVFHLAAIYDLAVPKDIAYQVNVIGTQNVNEWVKKLDRLERYIYFSTAYVSGKREGRIYEHELDEGQSFRNHYEQTKFAAELLVDDLKKEIPTTIIRPGVVKGDSKTGETSKFDGLYFLLNFLDRVKHVPVIPYIGRGEPEGNFIPADYLLQATSYLAIAPIGKGKTYHITDPNPYKMHEIFRMMCEEYLGKTPKGTIPVALSKASMSVAPIRKWFHSEKEALDYFLIHSSYDASQTVADLEGTGITCPDLKETLGPMIRFYRKYKDDKSKHITIV